MKRFLTFLCLLASLVVLAPQTILAEESSSGQATTKLDLSQKVGIDTLGYLTIPSDFVKFNELGEHSSSLLQWSSKDAFTVITLDKMQPYKGVENHPVFSKLPKPYAFATDRMALYATLPDHEKLTLGAAKDYPSSYKDVVGVEAQFKDKTLRLIYFTPESDPDSVYYLAVEGAPQDMDALEEILKSWTPK